jgi:predicted ArsR family transcriptional regulator
MPSAPKNTPVKPPIKNKPIKNNEKVEDKLLLQSGNGCPFSDSVAQHPEVCRLAETLLSEITGLEVREHCNRGDAPRCAFEIIADN